LDSATLGDASGVKDRRDVELNRETKLGLQVGDRKDDPPCSYTESETQSRRTVKDDIRTDCTVGKEVDFVSGVVRHLFWTV